MGRMGVLGPDCAERRTAVKIQDVVGVIEKLEKESKQEDAEAKAGLAFFKFHGKCTDTDQEKAIALWHECAAKLHGPSLNNLGLAYYLGKGVEQDFDEATDLWSLAALQNNYESMVNLGLASYYGNGVPKDHEISRNLWYRAGFEGNLFTGRNLFAACLKHGIGGEKDEDFAVNIWAYNARYGDTRAMVKLLEKFTADKNEKGVAFTETIIEKSLSRRSEKLKLFAELDLTYL